MEVANTFGLQTYYLNTDAGVYLTNKTPYERGSLNTGSMRISAGTLGLDDELFITTPTEPGEYVPIVFLGGMV